MKVSWRPWCNALRPYRVVSHELYSQHSTSWVGTNYSGTFWLMNHSEIAKWLAELPPQRFLFFKWKAAHFVDNGPTKPFQISTFKGVIHTSGDPPVIWMARKSDILLLKLTWGGNV